MSTGHQNQIDPAIMRLRDRGVVRVAGPEAEVFLQGLWTQDIARAQPRSPIHAAMLTPQGKYLFDAIVFRTEPDVFLLDTAQPEALAKRLGLYKLRTKVTVTEESGRWAVVAIPPRADVDGWVQHAGEVIGPDPRLSALGHRALVEVASLPTGIGDDRGVWWQHRLSLGVPDLHCDLVAEKDFALEGLLDELNGVDFHKGCYVGQEMTSRMKRRTTVRTKLCRVRYDGAVPPHQTAIEADDWEIGRMRSGVDGVGIALIRFDRAMKAAGEGQPLVAGETTIRLDPPDWLILPEIASG
jgi:tRNA-modifying protein YgfZ